MVIYVMMIFLFSSMYSYHLFLVSMLLNKSDEITPERMKRQSQSENKTHFWMWLVMELKSDAVKSNIA